jgi:hypothetical protein
MATEIEKKLTAINLVRNPKIGAKIGNENICADAVGHYQFYQTGESIFWHPNTGAHLVYGLVKAKWEKLGWERSTLGYPTTDETDTGTGPGRYNNFQNGIIIWKSGTNEAFAIYGESYQKWAKQGYDKGKLGFPTSDQYLVKSRLGYMRQQNFAIGKITLSTPLEGAFIKSCLHSEVYKVENSQRRWVPDPPTLLSMTTWDKVIVLSDAEVSSIPRGTNIPAIQVAGEISVDNRTGMAATVSFHNVGDDPSSPFTTIGMPTGVALAGRVTSFRLPLNYTQILVNINGSNTKQLSSGATYIWDKDERVHIFNDTDMPVTIRFFEPTDPLLSVPLFGVTDSTHVLPPHSDWYWTMPNNLTTVKYTFNNRNAEAKLLSRGGVARYSDATTVLISNLSNRSVRFLIFEWDDPEGIIYEPFLGIGDKTLSSHSAQIFTAPSNITDRVSIRVDVKPALLGDNRRTAAKIIVNLGDTLIYNEDGSVNTG